MHAVIAVLTGRRKVFYGWYILAGSVVAMALGSGTSFWAFGLYVEPLESDFGWSRAEVSLGFSISLLVSGLSGPLVGRWIDVRGPRSAIIVGAVFTALSYVLLATTAELWQWYAYNTVNAVFRQLMFFIPFQALISRWFDRRRGIALGILATGFSMGGFVVVPVMRVVIDSIGWEGSFVFSGAVILAVYVPMGLLLVRNSPAQMGTFVDGEPRLDAAGQPAPPLALGGITAGQALRSPYFWVMAMALTLFFYGAFGWLVHQVPFYESVGISRGVAAALVSAAAAGGMASRLVFGYLADRIPRIETAAMGLIACLMAGLTALLLDSGTAGIIVFLTFWVVGSGGGPLLEPLLLPRAFGLRHFASILGTLVVIETIGIIVSPAASGAIYDSTGSYDWALAMWLAALGGAFVLFYVASRMRRPYEPQAWPAEPRAVPAGATE
ncbi:MAG: MFS transporter [Dehalococcoidia bacterium]